MVTYTIEVAGSISGPWTPVYPKTVEFTDSLSWQTEPTAKFTFDNYKGANRQTLDVAKLIRIKRNGTLLYTGIINTPQSDIGANSADLSIETREFYRDCLTNKMTGPVEYWGFTSARTPDLFGMAIGTRFLVQDKFDNEAKYNLVASSNVCTVTDTVSKSKVLQLTNNGTAYNASGYLVSNTLKNSNWSTMGNISFVEFYIRAVDSTPITVDVSRNDGANWSRAGIAHNGIGWVGSYTFTDTNLITNGNCESAKPGYGGAYYEGGLTSALSAEQKHAGSNSLKLTLTSSGVGHFYEFDDGANPLLNGHTYECTAWVYVPSNSGISLDNVYLTINSYEEVDMYVYKSNTPTAYNTWQQLRVRGLITADTIMNWSAIEVNQNISSGSLYVDDVKLIDVVSGNNKFKYKINLSAASGNTVSPRITLIEFTCTTTSDICDAAGNPLLTEGTITPLTNTALPNNTVTQQFVEMSRAEMITNLLKITAQDAWIDPSGRLQVSNHRGSTIAKTFAIGTNIVALSRQRQRGPMANALTLIGGGLVSGSTTIYDTKSHDDPDSIAAYGRIEKIMKEKAISDPGVLAQRCGVLLDQLKVPQEVIKGKIIDGAAIDYSMGDNVTVTDSTGITGQSGALRITKITRRWATAGESVDVEFANVNTDLKGALDGLVQRIDSATDAEQPALSPQPISFQDDCDATHPAQVLVYIDPAKEVRDILLFSFSKQFRATTKAIALTADTSHKHGVPDHGHSIGLSSHHHHLSHTHTINMSIFNHAHSLGNHYHPIYDDTTGTKTSYAEDGVVTNHRHTVYHKKGCTEYVTDGVTGVLETGWHLWVGQWATSDTNTDTTTDEGASGVSSVGGGGSTTNNTDSHTHPINMDFGIYEFNGDANNGTGAFAPVTMHLNDASWLHGCGIFGTQGDGTHAYSVSGMSLMSQYDPTGEASYVLKPGLNYIYLKPGTATGNTKGLLRIYCDVKVLYK